VISSFESAYTGAVNTLASNPTQSATISVPGGIGTGTFLAGDTANTLASRAIVLAPQNRPGAGASTFYDTTTVYPALLAGGRGAGVPTGLSAEQNMQIGLVHEGFHYTRVEAGLAFGGAVDMAGPLSQAHQQPYNQAAMQLLGISGGGPGLGTGVTTGPGSPIYVGGSSGRLK
jgi:hypothetical protein